MSNARLKESRPQQNASTAPDTNQRQGSWTLPHITTRRHQNKIAPESGLQSATQDQLRTTGSSSLNRVTNPNGLPYNEETRSDARELNPQHPQRPEKSDDSRRGTRWPPSKEARPGTKERRRQGLRLLQCNCRRGYLETEEALDYFRRNNYDAMLMSEPYTRKDVIGGPSTVHCQADLQVFQMTDEGRTKACIFWKPESGVALGQPQWSTSNLAVIEIRLVQKRLFIASGYIEPEADPNGTMEAINNLFLAVGESMVCLGLDANGKHPSWTGKESDTRGVELADLATAHDFQVCNIGTTPTFESKNHKKWVTSIIDVTLASSKLAHLIEGWHVNLEACTKTDHNAIDFKIRTPELYKPINRESTFLFNNKTANFLKYRTRLREEYLKSDLPHLAESDLTEDIIDSTVVHLQEIMTSACSETMKLRGSYQKYNPFWTQELDDMKKEVIGLHHAVHSTKESGDADRLTDAVEVHLDAKAKYAKAIGRASTKHFRDFCKRQHKEDVWSVTNRIIKDAPRKTPPAMLKMETGFTRSPEEAANALLMNFYPDDGPDTMAAQSTLRETCGVLSDSTDDPPFVLEEINEVLESMNPDKAPGPDHFTSDIVTATVNELPKLCLNIMNSCLKHGRFPDPWKSAQVRILQKPGKDDYSQLSSFRPIGLLAVMGKLLEKLFIKRITYRAQQEDAWDPRQHGFKEQESTVTALYSLISKVKDARQRGLQVVGVSLDIKAAFDNAWWPSLMDGLRRTGCPRNIHLLIQDYFKRRTVHLHYGDANASKTVTKGCIQGSVCGPTFWNIILDGLLKESLPQGCHIQAYADDVMLLGTGKNMGSVQTKLNDALRTIHAWGRTVKLTFSPAKTYGISFTAGSKKIKLEMDATPVTMMGEIKLLGVIIDWRLSFINHVKYVITKVTKIFKNLCKFVRPTWGVSASNVEIINRHVIEPSVVYAAGVWGSAAKYDCVRRMLRTFQRSYAVRAIKGFHTVSAVSASALAQFAPLHLKIEESRRVEEVKLTGTFESILDDDELESRVRPDKLLHPSIRKGIDYSKVESQEDVDALGSDIKIFTDGSKLDTGKTGAAMVVRRNGRKPETRKYKLADHCTVYQAEMYAIYEAVIWVSKHGTGLTTAIYSDSRSSLDALKDRSHNSPLGVALLRTLSSLDPNTVVLFAWIRAHVGIDGNEAADAAAKLATEKHAAKVYTAFPISYAKRVIREETMKIWRLDYINAEQGSTTKIFLPTLDDAIAFRGETELTFEMTQILTGHCFSKAYLKRFRILTDDCCPCEKDTEQSLVHLLMSCPKYDGLRRRYFDLCEEAGVAPFDLADVVRVRHLMDAFVNFTHHVISTLKEFNSL